MVKIVWTKKSFQQLERAIKYIKDEQGISYAEIVLEKILASTRNLENNPRLGKIEPLLEHKKFDYRFIVVWSYKIIYRITKDSVIISRVFHTSRNPEKLKGI